MSFQRFTVTTEEVHGGWTVKVDAEDGEFASTAGPTVDVALRMALPYMACVAVPNPLDELLREARERGA